MEQEVPTRTLDLHIGQLLATQAPQEFVVLEWGRGSGKSTIMAWFIQQAVRQMPRSKGALSGVTYSSMLSETLPSTLSGLEKLGWYKDVHYFVGRRSPHHGWDEPYEPPASATAWANCIHFYNGAVLVLISQDPGKAEARGHNFDWGLADEAAQQNEKRLGNEMWAAMRTWRPPFIKQPMYHKKVLVSSTPVKREGTWFLKYEDLAKREPHKYFFLRCDWRFNQANLRPGWAKEMRAAYSSEQQYQAEIYNVRPRLTVNGYYPMLNRETHYYAANDERFRRNFSTYERAATDCRADWDVDPDRPLIMSFDPGKAINAAVVAQLSANRRELWTVRDFWVISPSIIQQLFEEKIIPWYQPHRRKVVYLFFDRTAYHGKADSKETTSDIIATMLRKHGWQVHVLAKRGHLSQHLKFHEIGNILQEGNAERSPDLLRVRINRDHAYDTTVSLENVEAKENSKKQIEKVKLSERRAASVPRQHANDLSDAFDLPVYHYGVIAPKLNTDDFMGLRTV